MVSPSTLSFSSSKAVQGGRIEMLPTGPGVATAAAFHASSKAFDNLRRHETAIETSY